MAVWKSGGIWEVAACRVGPPPLSITPHCRFPALKYPRFSAQRALCPASWGGGGGKRGIADGWPMQSRQRGEAGVPGKQWCGGRGRRHSSFHGTTIVHRFPAPKYPRFLVLPALYLVGKQHPLPCWHVVASLPPSIHSVLSPRAAGREGGEEGRADSWPDTKKWGYLGAGKQCVAGPSLRAAAGQYFPAPKYSCFSTPPALCPASHQHPSPPRPAVVVPSV